MSGSTGGNKAWLETYLISLEQRDQREKAHEETVKAYARLANRTVLLEQASQAAVEQKRPSNSTSPDVKSPSISARIPPSILPVAGHRTPSPKSQDTAAENSLREDLSAANRRIVALQQKLSTAESLNSTTQKSLESRVTEASALQRHITQLERDVQTLRRTLTDKDSELKEQRKLAANAQDEMVTMEMQLNVVEERAAEVKKENQELVDRWMQEMGRRADELNHGSGWK